MNSDIKNYILAIALSLGVIVLWQMYFPQPGRQQAPQQPSVEVTTTQPGGTGVPQAPAAGTAPGGSVVPGAALALPREAVLEQNARVKIDTPVLSGSINLKGARLDDLRLKEYHETVDDSSPTIVLLSPAGSAGAFFTEQGWVAPTGQTIKLPSSDTVWSTSGNRTLTPAAPVTLKWDNGEGLLFEQTFSIDDNYMMTVRQDITNNTSAAVNVFPYARVQRVGIPQITGIYVLHEGLLSVLDDALEEMTYSDAQDNGTDAYSSKSTGGWLGITDKYWAATLIPDQKMSITGTLRHLTIANNDAFQADYLAAQPVSAAPGARASIESRVFAGAKKSYLIDSYQEKLGISNFELMIDWGWFYFITKPLFKVLHYFNAMVGNSVSPSSSSRCCSSCCSSRCRTSPMPP